MIPLNSNLNEIIKEYLDKVHEKLFEKALKIREQKTYVAKTIEDLKNIYKSKSGFTKVMLCDNEECETKIKNEVSITSYRLIKQNYMINVFAVINLLILWFCLVNLIRSIQL